MTYQDSVFICSKFFDEWKPVFLTSQYRIRKLLIYDFYTELGEFLVKIRKPVICRRPATVTRK